MRPTALRSKIFVDSGDPGETSALIKLLGFLDGQTTNPTLISKNPEARERLARGEKFDPEEIFHFYRQVVAEISKLLPAGSVSVEVYADERTTAAEMLAQCREMFGWIPNAHIKFPTTTEGLKAAAQAVQENMRVNLTLCFSQEQAAAVYSATRGANRGAVFVSPFVGRMDDIGLNGMDLIRNILQMYRRGDGHVEVLTASVRNLEHLAYALQLGSDIITAPASVLIEWAEKDLPAAVEHYHYSPPRLARISYQDVSLDQDWREYDISHELTSKGIERFSSDWNNLIKNEK